MCCIEFPIKLNITNIAKKTLITESEYHKHIVKLFKTALKDKLYILHHSPNEHFSTIIHRFNNYEMGVLSGFPDLLIIVEGHIFFIEFKSKKGSLSKNQIKVKNIILQQGLHYFVFVEGMQFSSIANEINTAFKKNIIPFL